MFDPHAFGRKGRRPRALAVALAVALGAAQAPAPAPAMGSDAPPATSHGTTITVGNCLDDGIGSLREALEVLAHDLDIAVIDARNLACSTITLTTGALHAPRGHISVIGPGSDGLAISAGVAQRVVEQSDSTSYLAMSGLSIADGYSTTSGGCIEAKGLLRLDDVEVRRCTVSGGALPARGGAIHAQAILAGTRLRVRDSIVRSDVSAQGGGIFAEAELSIFGSTVSGNQAVLQGSAKYGFSEGGGIVAHGFAVIDSSTIVGNEAEGAGGIGVRNAIVSNTTISANRAKTSAGILAAESVGIENSTIALNCASDAASSVTPVGVGVQATYDLALHSTIVAGNGDCAPQSAIGTEAGFDVAMLAGAVAGSNNLVFRPQPGVQFPADTLSGIEPDLAPLADNGGLVATHALLRGSPAIDAGYNPRHLSFDARGQGFPREDGASADVGAFEFGDTIFADEFESRIRPNGTGGT